MDIVVKMDAGTALMDLKKKVSMSWSGGKDSALALYKILQDPTLEIVSLHTVVNAETKRVGMHGVPEILIERQAEEIGLPLVKLYLDPSESHQAYESLLKQFYSTCVAEGISVIAFGDIFLEDLKTYRETLLKEFNIEPAFPLWKSDSEELISEFLEAGFKTLICSANEKYFKKERLGTVINEDWIRSLPVAVDPCGENGEFHTFLFNAPYFKQPLPYQLGEVVLKDYHYQKEVNGIIEKSKASFWFQELLPC